MLDVCDPRVIRALLEKYGFHFSKAKGQNFLTQSWVPREIVLDAGIDDTCGVLEVGPGNALSGFVKKTLPGVVCTAVETPEQLDAVLTAWKEAE